LLGLYSQLLRIAAWAGTEKTIVLTAAAPVRLATIQGKPITGKQLSFVQNQTACVGEVIRIVLFQTLAQAGAGVGAQSRQTTKVSLLKQPAYNSQRYTTSAQICDRFTKIFFANFFH
jgi:hypothetical protein